MKELLCGYSLTWREETFQKGQQSRNMYRILYTYDIYVLFKSMYKQ